MSERNDERDTARRAAEGVRIIGPEEAQAALDAGAAAGRRPGDELRFGDVPPAPSGPRPPHRFPLPDSVDPADAVPRPPIVVPPRIETGAGMRSRAIDPTEAHDPRPWHERKGPDAAAATGDDASPTPAAPPTEAPRLWAPEAADAEADIPTGAHAALPPLPPEDVTVDLRLDVPVATPPVVASAPSIALPTAAEITAAEVAAPELAVPGAADAVPAHELPGGADPTGTPAGAHIPTGPRHLAPDPPVPTAWPAAEHLAPVVPAAAPHAIAPTGASAPGLPAAEPVPERPEESFTVSGGHTELPHWTDPPTGEVPRIRPGREGDDDLAAWDALGTRSATWRDDSTGWDEVDHMGDLADGEDRLGALDTTRTEHSDLFSFDEEFDRLEEERSGAHRAVSAELADPVGEVGDGLEAPQTVRVGGGGGRAVRHARQGRQARPVPGRRPQQPRGARPLRRSGGGGGGGGGTGDDGGGGASPGELGTRLGVGVGLVVLLLIAYAVGPVALLVLATAVIVAAAAEVYGMLRAPGFKPATLLGLVATVGILFAAYWRGPGALPLVTVMVFVVAMLWYLLGVVDARPLANVAVTVAAFVWVGVLGSYAALLLRAPHGKGLFVGALLPAVAADVGAYFTGRRFGSRPLAPAISPSKTVEGALGGAAAAVVVGLLVGHSLSPWGGFGHGLVLGLVVAVVAPIGDLFESMVKRDLNVKDSGSTLPGHGGVLDRFDAVLLVLPAAYYLASLWGTVH